MPKAKKPKKSKKPAAKKQKKAPKAVQTIRWYQPEGAPLARLQQLSGGEWADVPTVIGAAEPPPVEPPADHP